MTQKIKKTTLMNLLKQRNQKNYFKYKNIIKVCKSDMFENNGLYLKDVSFGAHSISFSFADTYDKKHYERTQMLKHNCKELSPVSAVFRFKWMTNNRGSIAEISYEKRIDYQNPMPIAFVKFPEYKGAKYLDIKLLIEDKLICCIEYPLGDIELL